MQMEEFLPSSCCRLGDYLITNINVFSQRQDVEKDNQMREKYLK